MRLELSRHARFIVATGEPVPLAPRDAALLAWLAIEGPTARSRLAGLLWPDSDLEASRNSLRQRLFKLRKQTGTELVSGSTTLALSRGVVHDLDDSDQVLGDAADEIGGEFGGWLGQQRQRRLDRVRQSLAELADMAEQARDWPDALTHAGELLALEPLSEEAHRRLIRLHYLAGDRAAALLAFDRCERTLKDEVGATPSAETLALLQTVEQSARAAVPSPQRVPAAVMRPPRVLGREAEVAAAHAAWAAGQVVALVGEAGMGKSRLLEHLLPAPASGSAVSVSARPGDAGVPLATVARLLRAVAERSPQTLEASARRELARVLPEWAPGNAPAPEGQRLVFQRAVSSLLARQSGLTMLALDDLHFADAASLNLLQALLDDETLRLRWALAYRPAEAGSALLALQAALLEHARVQPLVLRPLDIPALAALVDSLALPGVDGTTLAPGLLRRTGGNPLFVLETLKQAWVEQSLGQLADAKALPRPASVARLIEWRIGQLSPGALAVARCAAIAGQDFSTRLATRVLATPALALASAWAELEAAHILRDEAFVHDLFFEATLASVPGAIARHLHGEIAEALQADGHAAPATLARHWLAAGQPRQAAPQLERAAQAAARALDPAEAARLWAQLAELRERALDPTAAFDAALQAVLALRATGSGAELAAAIDRLALLAQQPLQQAQVHELRAGMFHTRGESAQAAASLALGLQALGPEAPVVMRVNLLNMQGIVLRRAGQPVAARDALQQALALARSAEGADADLAAVLNNLGLLLQEQDDHLAAIGLMQEAAERQADPLVRARVLNNLAISLEERGQVVMAREQRLSAARLVHGAGAMADLNLAISLGANARNLGRYRDALAHLEHARALAAGEKHWREEDLQRQYGALWLDLGRYNLAREALEHGARLTAGRPDAGTVGIVRARLALAQQRDAGPLIEATEAALLKVGEPRVLRRFWVVKAQWLPPAEALALMQEQLQAPTLRDNVAAALPMQVRLAQALLALGRPDEALRHAQRAADWLQAVRPLEMSPAEVQLTLARASLAAGDRVGAVLAAGVGRDAVLAIAEVHLDPIYREGWLQRNPVNAELLALAAQLDAR